MKTVVITGAASGIGYAVAKALAAKSYRVIGVDKTKKECDRAVWKIGKTAADANVQFFCGDLSRQTDVNRVADEIGKYINEECDGRLDVLINYADTANNWNNITAEGYERQFALNHLAGFMLTHRLMPYLQKSGGRVIMTGTGLRESNKVHWKNFMYNEHYQCIRSYEETKLCNLLFVQEFNRRFTKNGVRAYVVDPGFNITDNRGIRTRSIRCWFWRIRCKCSKKLKAAVQTYEYLCAKMPAPQGLNYYQCIETKLANRLDNESESKRRFELSEKICEIEFACNSTMS